MAQNKFMSKGVGLAIAVLVVGILVAFTLPIAINAMNDNSIDSYNQSVGSTIEVTNNLNGTLDSTNAGSNVTVTLNDTKENVQKSVTVSDGTNETVAMPNGDVTVHNDASRADSADLRYEYPQDYGWGGAESSLFGLLPLFFVIAILLLVVGKATNQL